MRAVGLVGLVIVLGVGFYLFNRSASTSPGGMMPQERIDTIAVRQQLLAIAQTERQYLATHGSYATLEQLGQDQLLPGGTEQRGYTFTAVATGGERFTITARPTDANKAGWPTLEITERMEVIER
jgi:Tfp pilus assembly protein PilE